MNTNTKTSSHFRGVLLTFASFLGLPLALANPLGPTVVNGQVGFAQEGGQLNVTNSPGAIINWQSFSINANETTRFVQQNAASSVLNRVTGQDPSVILGALQSNGRVFLINPSGIVFGQGARVDVAGLVASTLNITDQDFLANKLNFASDSLAGALKNYGAITTPSGGSVYLIASDVENSGVITSPSGEIILAAGKSVILVDTGTPNVRAEITAPDNRAINIGSLVAESGRIGIYAGIIGHSGIARADSAVLGENGKIVFKATKDITLEAGSITSANGPQGGHITVQSETGTTQVSGAVEAVGAVADGGTVQLLGTQVNLGGGAVVDASGQTGGGTVLVGGDHQGQGVTPTAAGTEVDAGAAIRADALGSGNGGKVIVWSDGTTAFNGWISARGGVGGDGGFAEVSGKQHLLLSGHADLSSLYGQSGTLLLDPGSVRIIAGSNTAPSPLLDTFNNAWVVDQLNNSSNLIISTADSTNNLAENIAVSGAVSWNSANSLTLIAGNNVNVNATIANAGSGRLNLTAGNTFNVGADLGMAGGGPVSLTGTTAKFTAGTARFGTGSSYNIPGATTMSGATVNFDIPVSLSALNLSSGTLGGTGAVTLGSLVLNGGILSGTGSTTVSGSFSVNGAPQLDGRKLTLNGSSTLSGTSQLQVNNGAYLVNNGAMDLAGDAQVAMFSGTGSTIENNGSITKSAGTGSSQISATTLNNKGTLNVNTGTVSLLATGTGTHSGIFNVANSATLQISGAGAQTFTNTSQINGAGAVNVIGAVGINGAYNIGSTTISGGALNFNNTAATATTTVLNLAGGAVGGAGNLNVTGDFNQTGGSFTTSGNISLTRATGNFLVNSFTANSVTLNAPGGAIVDNNGDTVNITAGSVTLNAATGIGSGNALELVTANLNTSNGSGNTEIINNGALTVTGMMNTGLGNIFLDNTGGVVTSGLVQAVNGKATITAHSPLTVGNSGIYASGDITLQTGAGNGILTLSGPVVSSNGSLILQAADGLVQNSSVSASGTGTISASSVNSNIALAPSITVATGGGAITYAAPNGEVIAAQSQFIGASPTIIELPVPVVPTSVQQIVSTVEPSISALISTSAQSSSPQQGLISSPVSSEQQILAGADPTQVTEPTAAGGTEGESTPAGGTKDAETSQQSAPHSQDESNGKKKKLSNCN